MPCPSCNEGSQTISDMDPARPWRAEHYVKVHRALWPWNRKTPALLHNYELFLFRTKCKTKCSLQDTVSAGYEFAQKKQVRTLFSETQVSNKRAWIVWADS